MIECIKFKSYEKGSLLGFADFFIEKWGIELYGCSLHMKDGKRWINLPSKPFKNELGEEKYSPYIRFRDKAHWEKFIDAAKGAIDEYCKKNLEHNQSNQETSYQAQAGQAKQSSSSEMYYKEDSKDLPF